MATSVPHRPPTLITKRKIEDIPSPPPPSTSAPTTTPTTPTTTTTINNNNNNNRTTNHAAPPQAISKPAPTITSPTPTPASKHNTPSTPTPITTPTKTMLPLRKRFTMGDTNQEDSSSSTSASATVTATTNASASTPATSSSSATNNTNNNHHNANTTTTHTARPVVASPSPSPVPATSAPAPPNKTNSNPVPSSTPPTSATTKAPLVKPRPKVPASNAAPPTKRPSSEGSDNQVALPPRKKILSEEDKVKKEGENGARPPSSSSSATATATATTTATSNAAAGGADKKKPRSVDNRKLEKLASRPVKKRKVEPEKGKKKKVTTKKAFDSDDEQSDEDTASASGSSDSEGDDDESDDDGKLYCLCRKPYERAEFMIACDSCDDWFHVRCVGISQAVAKRLKHYVCPNCKQKGKEPVIKAKKEKTVKTGGVKKTTKLAKGSGKTKNGRKSVSPSPTSPDEGKGPGRKCLNETCTLSAKVGSKYCSTRCGIMVAEGKLKGPPQKPEADLTQFKQELREVMENLKLSIDAGTDSMVNLRATMGNSAAESEDVNSLEEINSKKKEIEKNLEGLFKRTEELEQAIERASTLFSSKAVASSKLPFARPDSRDTMDCPACGKAVALSGLARHLEQCTVKKERTKSSADKNRLCGCPTNESEGYCTLPRDNCFTHTGWEVLRKGALVQERCQLEESINSLTNTEKTIRLRINRRRQGSGAEQHRTIVENRVQAVSPNPMSPTISSPPTAHAPPSAQPTPAPAPALAPVRSSSPNTTTTSTPAPSSTPTTTNTTPTITTTTTTSAPSPDPTPTPTTTTPTPTPAPAPTTTTPTKSSSESSPTVTVASS